MSKTYDDDFYTWTMTQADAARRRSANEFDWDNVAEELETLGKAEARELHSRYVVLLTHMLKWAYQPGRRGRSWSNTIAIQRRLITRHMRQNPGLKPNEREEFIDAYGVARLKASNETKLELETFPETLPFTMEQAMDNDWLPG